MRFARPAAFLAILAIGACSTPQGQVPSLAPRAAETIDPRLPVGNVAVQTPVDAALAARLAELIAVARQGDSAFSAAAGEAQRLAAAAGAPQSESWVVAQQALSAAVDARAPTARALGDIDALGATMLQTQGGLAPADLAAIESAGQQVGALDQRQADRVSAVQARLGS